MTRGAIGGTIRVAIVDDEPLARTRLRRLLAAVPDVCVTCECEHGGHLDAALTKSPVDLIFLDIDMPGRDGLTIAKALPAPRPLVVFVTAYAEYAPHAFDVDAVGYLVKPFQESRLHSTLRRARVRLSQQSLHAIGPRAASLGRIALPVGRRLQLVEVSAIDCAHAQENYVEIRAAGRRFLMRQTLTWLESRLDARWFLRVHRSTIVRIEAVAEVKSLNSGRYELLLANGERIVSGRSYRERVREALGLPIPSDSIEP